MRYEVADLNLVLKAVAEQNKGNVKFPIYDIDGRVDELRLTSRPALRLKRAKIVTIADLIDNWNRLSSLEGMGEKSIQETRYALCEFMFENLGSDNSRKAYLQRILDLN